MFNYLFSNIDIEMVDPSQTVTVTPFRITGFVLIHLISTTVKSFKFNWSGSWDCGFFCFYGHVNLKATNCTFDDFNSSTTNPILIDMPLADYYTDVTTFINTSISNIRVISGTSGEGDSMVANLRNTKVTLINCTYSNITVVGDGGAIRDNVNSEHYITRCTFDNCSSSAGRGGAIVIGNTVPSITYCKFSSNSASSGGNDVYHNSSTMISSYTADKIVGTCSSSNGTHFEFSGGSNIDNLISGTFVLNFISCLFLYFFFFFL
jgi:hypothetical protein